MHNIAHIKKAADYIEQITNNNSPLGIVLGSGLGSFADHLDEKITISYDNIPHFIKSQAAGHANKLISGKIAGKNVLVMSGRFHYYEGSTLDQITFPIRVMRELGVKKLILTNAAGAINTEFRPGEFMLISDHINLTATNPLIGPNNPKLGVRFLDTSEIYNKTLRGTVKSVGQKLDIPLKEGVYAWSTGPSYETPAEIRMMRTLGADAVGMSTVPEAIVAHHAGIQLIAISCLTNMACGILAQPLNHQEVIDVANKAKVSLLKLLVQCIKQL